MVENYQTHFFVAFETYKEEAGVRLDEDRLKPGEKVSRKLTNNFSPWLRMNPNTSDVARSCSSL